ncbi:MAG: hypothetical protein ABJC79_03310 [Acidimicrobiia bacterium]
MRRTLVSAVVLVIALGACGSTTDQVSKSSKVSTVALVAGAADRASAAKTARVAMHMSLPIAGDTKDVSIDGLVDFQSNAVEMTMDMGALGAGAGSIKLRMVDGVMYMDMGELLKSAGQLPAALDGKTWFKIDMGKLAGAGAANPAGQQQNPADLLQTLRGAGDVERLGTDDIRGTKATHYRVHVNLEKAIAALDNKLADQMRASMGVFKSDLPVDVWIGDDGLPRRETMTLATGKNAMKISMDFFDFGVDAQIVAPPAEDTADFSEFSNSFGASASAN